MPLDQAVLEQTPRPVQTAQAVLNQLDQEGQQLFKKILPGLAIALDRAGETVTAESLRAYIKKGLPHIQQTVKDLRKKSHPQNIERTYDDIVKNFPAPEKTPEQRMIEAAEKGHLEVVRYFHEHGVDLTAEDNQALRSAAGNGHLDVVRYCHENGGDLTAEDSSALRWAAGNGYLDVVQYCHENGCDLTARDNDALHGAAIRGYLDVVRYCHENSGDLTVKNNDALRWAAARGHLDVVRYCHEHGGDLTTRDNEALRGAAVRGHLDVVRYCHEHGGDLTAEDNHALRVAAVSGHLDVVRYCHEHGANLTAVDNEALRVAAANGHIDVVQYCHEHGCDLTARDNEALRVAAIRGHLDIVQYCHENGYDLTARDNEVLRLAIENAHMYNSYIHIVQYYDEQGADISILSPDCLQKYQQYKDWLSIHPHSKNVARDLLSCSPYFHSPTAFDAVREMINKEDYCGRTAMTYAYNIAGLFKSEQRVLQYLEKWGKAGAQPLHDIGQHITLPKEGRPDLKSWGDAVLQHGPKMARFVKYADRLPQPEKSDCGNVWSYTKTKEKLAEFAFKNGSQDPYLATICFDFGWDNDDFDSTLKQIKKYQEKYAANDNRKMLGRIPDIQIDGKKFGKEDYRFYKLPDGDVRGLLLGEFTDCCQHLAGAGSACAKHGFLSEDGGFYVVANKKSDQIIAQSWAWRGSKGELVFDSLESLGSSLKKDNWQDLCTAFGKALQKTENDISAFHVGGGGATPRSLAFEKAATLAEPINYNKYRDSSNTQYVIWQKLGAGKLLNIHQ